MIREIQKNEVYKLRVPLEKLAEYHNQVSDNFSGFYPRNDYDATLKSFEEGLADGTARIAVAEADENVIGFCQISLNGDSGKLVYLMVLEAFRGRGYGKELMDWAMAAFEAAGINLIEIKVIAGNPAIHLYEKYGFKMNAHLLWRAGEMTE